MKGRETNRGNIGTDGRLLVFAKRGVKKQQKSDSRYSQLTCGGKNFRNACASVERSGTLFPAFEASVVEGWTTPKWDAITEGVCGYVRSPRR